MAKKMIPCKVCGKLFEPCAYCQAHSKVFYWRGFACSRECAEIYIQETIAYREKCREERLKAEAQTEETTSLEETAETESVEKTETKKKTRRRKKTASVD